MVFQSSPGAPCTSSALYKCCRKGKGATLLHRPYDHPTTKLRLRQARQAEKENRSSNEEESRMLAERLEFQTFNNKQSQHCQPSNQGKPFISHPGSACASGRSLRLKDAQTHCDWWLSSEPNSSAICTSGGSTTSERRDGQGQQQQQIPERDRQRSARQTSSSNTQASSNEGPAGLEVPQNDSGSASECSSWLAMKYD
eukprot:1142957-Pelagomonas_calceolata.AAC.4